MRTLIIILGGLVVLGIFSLIGKMLVRIRRSSHAQQCTSSPYGS
jgi:hypothetical protein